MISIIIIGKNIERTIKICIESVKQTLDKYPFFKYEILYVDSDSSDSSVRLAMHYPINIFVLKGNVNSAVGRNIGAKSAKGEILFFLDGDMELLDGIFEKVFLKDYQNMIYPFIKGLHHHLHYNDHFNYLFTKDDPFPTQNYFSTTTGGLMIITKKLWEKMEGMDERLIRNQDVDFGLRLTKAGIPPLCINHFFVNHHTISYCEGNRLKYFLSSKALLAPGLLMRKHLFNLSYIKLYNRNILYLLVLMSGFIFVPIKLPFSLLIFIFYILIQLYRSLKIKTKSESFFNSFLFKLLFSLYTLIGLIFYYPSKPIYSINKIK